MTDTPAFPAIVLVEDEPDIQIILHRLMRDLAPGCDVLIASDGPAAMELAAQRAVQLVITD